MLIFGKHQLGFNILCSHVLRLKVSSYNRLNTTEVRKHNSINYFVGSNLLMNDFRANSLIKLISVQTLVLTKKGRNRYKSGDFGTSRKSVGKVVWFHFLRTGPSRTYISKIFSIFFEK